MPLFRLQTPGDMLAKARRERKKMADQIDADHVYNFFTTVTHISDYVRHSGLVGQVDLDGFRQNEIFKLSRDLCDAGKHFKLTRPGRTTPSTGVYQNNMFLAPFGTWNFGPQTDNWMVHSGDKWMHITIIADEMLLLWAQFFKEHEIDHKPSSASL